MCKFKIVKTSLILFIQIACWISNENSHLTGLSSSLFKGILCRFESHSVSSLCGQCVLMNVVWRPSVAPVARNGTFCGIRRILADLHCSAQFGAPCAAAAEKSRTLFICTHCHDTELDLNPLNISLRVLHVCSCTMTTALLVFHRHTVNALTKPRQCLVYISNTARDQINVSVYWPLY